MFQIICVGVGGFIGAVCRYLLGLIPWQGDFPLITFGINFVGSFIIGIVAEVAFVRVDQVNNDLILFLRTGFCGGFTTLSAMGVETIVLFDKGKYLLGTGYAVASVVCCLIGVTLGRGLVRLILGTPATTA